MRLRATKTLLLCLLLLPRAEVLAAPLPQDRVEQANRLITEGKFEQARQALEAILQTEPSPPAIVYYYLAYSLFNQNQFTQAEDPLEKFLRENPSSPQGRLLKAQLLFRRGSYQASAALAQAVLKEQTENAGVYKLLGLDLFMLGHSEPAERAFLRATELSPKDVEAVYYLGRIRFERNNLTAALEAFQQAIAIDPKNVKALNHLGQTYEWMAKYDLAREAYLKSIEMERRQTTRSEWPYFNLGALCLKQGKPGEAEAYLRLALERNPSWGEAKAKLAQALLALDRRDEPLQLLKDAVNLDPQNREVRYRYAQLLMKNGQREEALRQFEALEKAKP